MTTQLTQPDPVRDVSPPPFSLQQGLTSLLTYAHSPMELKGSDDRTLLIVDEDNHLFVITNKQRPFTDHQRDFLKQMCLGIVTRSELSAEDKELFDACADACETRPTSLAHKELNLDI